jgi:hypothetical protein
MSHDLRGSSTVHRQSGTFDGWGPCLTDVQRQHKVIPEIEQQCTIHIGQHVVGSAFPQHNLVPAGTLPPIPEVKRAIRLRPIEVQR